MKRLISRHMPSRLALNTFAEKLVNYSSAAGVGEVLFSFFRVWKRKQQSLSSFGHRVAAQDRGSCENCFENCFLMVLTVLWFKKSFEIWLYFFKYIFFALSLLDQLLGLSCYAISFYTFKNKWYLNVVLSIYN